MISLRQRNMPSGASMRGILIRAAIVASTIIVLWGCDLSENLIKDHKKICEKQSKVLIHNEIMWNEYVEGSNEAFQKRKSEFSGTKLSVPEHVFGFDIKFGEDLMDDPTFISRKILRNDIFILKNQIIVAQFVDFTSSYKSMDGKTNFSCTGWYPDLYNLETTSNG